MNVAGNGLGVVFYECHGFASPPGKPELEGLEKAFLKHKTYFYSFLIGRSESTLGLHQAQKQGERNIFLQFINS
jgi:transposase